MDLALTLDTIMNTGLITIHQYRAHCAHCGHDLGPTAALGLVIDRATQHLPTVQVTIQHSDPDPDDLHMAPSPPHTGHHPNGCHS